MDDRVCSALFFLISVVPAVAEPLPEGVVARIAPAPGEPAFTGRIWTALSPDGRTVAVTDIAGRLDLWDISGKRLKTLRTTGPRGEKPQWSPDGQRLYAGHSEGVAVWDLTKSGAPRVLGGGVKSTEGRHIAVSPDGSFVVAGATEKTTICWDADTGRERWRVQYDGPIGISPDSRFVVRSYFGERFEFLDAETGKEARSVGRPLITCKQTFSDSFALSGDGRRMAVSTNGHVALRDAITGIEIWHQRVGLIEVDLPVFSVDGHWLVTTGFAGFGTTFIVWDTVTGQLLCERKTDGFVLTSIDFTPDGRRMLAGSGRGTALLWDLAPTASPVPDAFAALCSQDGPTSYAALWALAQDRDGASILRSRIPTIPRLSAADLDRLIADLDANRHAVRERATRALAEQGRAALPALGAALARGQSPEASARLEKLLQACSGELTATEIVHRRAVKAMSLAGTPDARAILAEWAAGAPGAVLTDAARAILARR